MSVSAPGRIKTSRILELADTAALKLKTLRRELLLPNRSKTPPELTTGRLAALCGISNDVLAYRVKAKDLPQGTIKGKNRRVFSVGDAQVWAREYRPEKMRPEGTRGVTIAVGNFKGGVTKTTTAMTLAQGLSLRGHRVLCIDLDPQGSLTTLFGLSPEEVTKDDPRDRTCLSLFRGEESSVKYAIQKTYWEGIDLVMASPLLYNAEFELPAQQMQLSDEGFRFYEVLNAGLEEVRDEYDVIIIDTAPSLSYVVFNAYMAADGMIVPMPPNALDYASSAQFWGIFADLLGTTVKWGAAKEFDFLHVLLAKVDPYDDNGPIVTGWVNKTYNEFVMPVEIPQTNATKKSSVEFGTVFDVTKYEGGHASFKRALDAYNRVVDLVEHSIVGAWQNQLAEALPAATKDEVTA